jgi:hypothetical protein
MRTSVPKELDDFYLADGIGRLGRGKLPILDARRGLSLRQTRSEKHDKSCYQLLQHLYLPKNVIRA